MSENATIDSLKNLCADAEREMRKHKASIEKLQLKLVDAKARFTILNEALETVTKASEKKPRPLPDMVDQIIVQSGLDGISIRDIQLKLEENVNKVDPAAVHVAVARLHDKGMVEMITDPDRGKLFRRPVPITPTPT